MRQNNRFKGTCRESGTIITTKRSNRKYRFLQYINIWSNQRENIGNHLHLIFIIHQHFLKIIAFSAYSYLHYTYCIYYLSTIYASFMFNIEWSTKAKHRHTVQNHKYKIYMNVRFENDRSKKEDQYIYLNIKWNYNSMLLELLLFVCIPPKR